VQLKVVPGDVTISSNISDVRCYAGASTGLCGSANDEAGPDYFGRLEVDLPVRITDRDNLPSPGGDSPGTGDTTISLFAYCTTTTDTTVGGSCPLQTSAKALLPADLAGGRRAILQFGQVQVLDGGSDGYGTNPQPFLREGVFVP